MKGANCGFATLDRWQSVATAAFQVGALNRVGTRRSKRALSSESGAISTPPEPLTDDRVCDSYGRPWERYSGGMEPWHTRHRDS